MTWKLVNGIGDNEEIKQGLYPSSGGNASLSKGGSKTKADYHWALAEYIFESEPDYRQAIQDASKDNAAGERWIWGLKVKNRVQRYAGYSFVLNH